MLCEAVAYAAHGLDDPGISWIVAQLVAEVRDMHVDDVLVVVLVALHVLEQLRAGKDPTRLACQCHQQAELARRQKNGSGLDEHLVARRIDRQAAEAQHWW